MNEEESNSNDWLKGRQRDQNALCPVCGRTWGEHSRYDYCDAKLAQDLALARALAPRPGKDALHADDEIAMFMKSGLDLDEFNRLRPWSPKSNTEK